MSNQESGTVACFNVEAYRGAGEKPTRGELGARRSQREGYLFWLPFDEEMVVSLLQRINSMRDHGLHILTSEETADRRPGPLYFVLPEGFGILPTIRRCIVLTYSELVQGVNIQDIAHMTYAKAKLPPPDTYPRSVDIFRQQIFHSQALAKAYTGLRLPSLAPLDGKLKADFETMRAQARTTAASYGAHGGPARPRVRPHGRTIDSRSQPRRERPQPPSKRRAIEYRRPTPEPMDIDPVNWFFVHGRERSPPFSLTTTAGPASPRSEDLGDIGVPDSDAEMEDSDLWDLRTSLQTGLVAVDSAGGLIWVQRRHADEAGVGRTVELDPVDLDEEERWINDGVQDEQPIGAQEEQAEVEEGDDGDWEDVVDQVEESGARRKISSIKRVGLGNGRGRKSARSHGRKTKGKTTESN